MHDDCDPWIELCPRPEEEEDEEPECFPWCDDEEGSP